MIDEQMILTAEVFATIWPNFAHVFGSDIQPLAPSGRGDDRKQAALLAETWLVELSTDQKLGTAIGSATLADLNVHFQRLLTFAEHATIRSRYDAELRTILKDYSVKVVLPLKAIERTKRKCISSSRSSGDCCPFGFRWTVVRPG
jgi:hypothetical protein